MIGKKVNGNMLVTIIFEVATEACRRYTLQNQSMIFDVFNILLPQQVHSALNNKHSLSMAAVPVSSITRHGM